jgi:hypothetical protein
MISATQILTSIFNVSEEWKKVYRDKSVEVLDDLLSWSEASRAFKELIQDDRKRGINPTLRFSYNQETDVLKVWVGSLATHDQIISTKQNWRGIVSIDKKLARVTRPPNDETILRYDELPERVQDFVAGLKLVEIKDTKERLASFVY